jgi:hypothetical protein
MNGTMAAVALFACAGLVGCAGGDAPNPAPVAAAAPVQPAASAPIPSPPSPIGASLTGPGGVWRVRALTCGQLLAAPARDRDAALMFYYGRLAQRAGTQAIEVGKLDADLRFAMDQCAHSPALPAAAAFQQQGRGPSTAPRWFWDTF